MACFRCLDHVSASMPNKREAIAWSDYLARFHILSFSQISRPIRGAAAIDERRVRCGIGGMTSFLWFLQQWWSSD